MSFYKKQKNNNVYIYNGSSASSNDGEEHCDMSCMQTCGVVEHSLFILKTCFIIKPNSHNSFSKLVLKQHRLEWV